MFYVVSGGSGSGKSEFAENTAVTLNKLNNEKKENLIYIATMIPFDQEAEKKIARHRKMRKDKQFETVECFTGLNHISLPRGRTVLLDCMSNLAANEMFSEGGAGEDTCVEIIKGIKNLLAQSEHVVIVTNEIFSDGCQYDETTKNYIANLAKINCAMVKLSDAAVEVVCGIPIYHKGKEWRL